MRGDRRNICNGAQSTVVRVTCCSLVRLACAKAFKSPFATSTRTGPVLSTLLLIGVLSASCAQLPAESVALSTLIGQDLAALQTSYDQLIQRHFDSLRAQREMYLQAEWIRQFVGDWMRNGRLLDIANGTIVWSETASDFVAPTPGVESAEMVYSIQVWAEEAVWQIQTKRAELMAPLDADEASLRADVASAFANVINANATLTAHISSVRRVRDAQNRVLDLFNLRQTRDDLNDRLIEISNRAESGLQDIRQADGFIDRLQEATNNGRDDQ